MRKEQKYFIFENEWSDQGNICETTHKYDYAGFAVDDFFNLIQHDGWYHHFYETEKYFVDYMSNDSDAHESDLTTEVALKKWKGWQDYFSIIFKVSYTKDGENRSEVFMNQKELIDRIGELEETNIFLYQPEGFGTKVSVYECSDDDVDPVYQKHWECRKIEGYEVEYILVKNCPMWEIKRNHKPAAKEDRGLPF